ncbi:zinc finger protein 516 [Paramormyrops kingsleyae]|uniref:zinc finger protein 516 n=1 Tax=Paramormyrops kingsleyae TaxID=1676925 RepID=UPI000CD64841|nr:zinc finger protein 516 isoform X2 [Paramormyrops kingsleyae]
MERQHSSEGGVQMGRIKAAIAEEDGSAHYACSVCGRSFPFQSSLSQHMRKHTEARPYKCPYCDHREAQKGRLKVHIRSHRMGVPGRGHEQTDAEGDEEEAEVGERQNSEVGVSEGLDSCASPTKSTSACNQMVNGSPEGTRGKVQSRSAWTLSLQCTICSRKLGSQAELDKHSQLCRLCSHVAQRENQLLDHLKRPRIPEDAAPGVGSEGESGEFSCGLCGQSFAQAWLLKAHTKKHLGPFEHACHVCGRRFREAWFLKNHMKTHSIKANCRGKSRSELEPPATINNVVQDEAVMVRTASLYELCFKCGNLFHDRENLQIHNRIHSRASHLERQDKHEGTSNHPDSSTAKKLFLECLNLQPTEDGGNKTLKNNLGTRILELDPVCSYQTWQLATKGRVTDSWDNGKDIGWEEVPVDGDLGNDQGTGESIPVGQEKRKREADSHYGSGGGKRRNSGSHAHHHSGNGHALGDFTPESLSDSEYRPPSRAGRRSSQSKATECFECGKVFRTRTQMAMHTRTHRRGGGRAPRGDRGGSVSEAESGSASRPSTPRSGSSLPASRAGDTTPDRVEEKSPTAGPDEKQHVCGACEFRSSDSSTLAAHLLSQHATGGSLGKSGTSVGEDLCKDPGLKGGPAPACSGNSAPYSSPERVAVECPHLEPGVHNGKVKEKPRLSEEPPIAALDLSICVGAPPVGTLAPPKDTPPGHECSYCSYITHYPEVLWIHQTVAHKVKSSALIPCWAPRSRPKGASGILASWRRTGPPPASGGKECPGIPTTRSARTQPPNWDRSGGGPRGSTTTGSGSQGAASSRISRSGVEEARQQRPKPETQTRPVERSPDTPQPPLTSPKMGARPAERHPLPQEGLGFMLSSKHNVSHHAPSPGLPPPPAIQSQAKLGQQDPTSPGGRNPGGSQTRGISVMGSPLSHPATKYESAPNSPVDILNFLKNCQAHDLATLYQRWGSSSPLLTHTGMLRSLAHQGDYICRDCGRSFSQPSHLRTHMRSHTVVVESSGLRGSDAHTPPAEAPKQGRAHSGAGTARTSPLRKGT